jgi:hypothetical protein
MIAAGVIGGLAAALFDLIDWLAIPVGTRTKSVGLWPLIGTLEAQVVGAYPRPFCRPKAVFTSTGARE